MENGTRLLHYEILGKLGAGGMGEVYRAEDARLKRQVAIKVLPAELADDPERLGRLEREAQLLAALEHPNVAAVYGLEQDGSTRFLVMQLADGETLADRMAGGALPVDEALPVAAQIAAGLAAAHDQGIVHRDLKPANVMVAGDDTVKVLDFGLAKATTTAGLTSGTAPDLTASPTAFAATQAGMILGTASYMSPEQARGREVDRRTDLWGLGCVLYELLTGTQAFTGDTASDIIASILRQEPDWERLPADLPASAERLLRRCLQKDAQQRQRDAGDAALELREATRRLGEHRIAAAPTTMPTRATSGGWMRLAPWAVAAAALLALAVQLGGGSPAPSPTGLRVDWIEQVIQRNAILADPSLAPDGSFYVYTSNENGDFDIYNRRTEGAEGVNITDHPADDIQPAVSPDGNQVAFVSTRASDGGLTRISDNLSYDYRTYGGDIWIASSLGGAARRLAENGNYPDWHPDSGSLVYVSGAEGRREIWRVPAQQGDPELLLSGTDSPGEIVRVKHSPDGRWLSLETFDDKLFLMPADGGAVEDLLQASSHSWSYDGTAIYYLRADLLGAVELRVVDFRDGATRPESDRRAGFLTGIFGDLVTSSAGQLMVLQLQTAANLRRIAVDPERGVATGPEEVLTTGQVMDRLPEYSADGRYIAFESTFGSLDTIALFDLETMTRSTLQLPGSSRNRTPTWHPDGRRLSVLRETDTAMEIWDVAFDGSAATKMLDLNGGSANIDAAHYSPDASAFAFPDLIDGHLQLFVADVETGERRQVTAGPGDRFDVDWTPDAKWLLYGSSASGDYQVWRVEVAGGDEEQMTYGPGRVLHPSTDPTGQWVYLQPDHKNIYRIPIDGGEMSQVTFFPESGLYIDEPHISPDGTSLLYTRSTVSSGLWLITLAGAEQ